MKLCRSTISLALAGVFCACAVLGSGCGKDKPAEEPAPETAKAPDEAKTDEAKPDEAKPDEAKAAADPAGEAAARGDTKLGPDDPKGRFKPGRERPVRRPRPLKDGEPMVAPGDGAPAGENKPGLEPGALPDGGVPVVDGGPTPPIVAGAPEPNPGLPMGDGTAPTPGPGPGEPAPLHPGEPPGMPAVPGEPQAPELAPPHAPEAAPPHVEIRNDAAAIDAAAILPSATVTDIIGKTLESGTPLQGIAIVAGYGSIFYAATEAAKFGTALQVWQDPTRRESDDRFRRMRLQYPNAQDVTVLQPSKAFFSYYGTLNSLTWTEPAKRMVLSVTCGEGLCSHEQLVKLAKSARERL